jgi:hypothetical protein
MIPPPIHFLGQCLGVGVKYARSGIPGEIVKASKVLSQERGGMLDKMLLGKQVVYIAPATDLLDVFSISGDRMVCPILRD